MRKSSVDNSKESMKLGSVSNPSVEEGPTNINIPAKVSIANHQGSDASLESKEIATRDHRQKQSREELRVVAGDGTPERKPGKRKRRNASSS